MIITVKNGENLISISRRYCVPVDKIASDNGLGINDSLVTGQSLIVLKEKTAFVPVKNTTVKKISSATGLTERKLWQNNFFLGGRQSVPQYSFAVLEYEKNPVLKKITGGYAYDFISISKLKSVINYLNYITYIIKI